MKLESRPNPIAGQLYRHRKGTLYEVITIALHSETKEPLVIYQSKKDGRIWARPLDMFMDSDGSTYRFSLCTTSETRRLRIQLGETEDIFDKLKRGEIPSLGESIEGLKKEEKE